MQQKTKLINSMANLISHVSKSKINQQEIFNTLSPHDLKKMLGNLQDVNEKLRKITLLLLAQLLYHNSELQQKFCHLMAIYPSPGKVVFNTHLSKTCLNAPHQTVEILKLLKQPVPHSYNSSYFWYLNLKVKPIKVQFVLQNNINIDPLQNIVGFVIPSTYQESPEKLIQKNYFQPTIVFNENNKKLSKSFQQPFENTQKGRRISYDEQKEKYFIRTDVKRWDGSKMIRPMVYNSYQTAIKQRDKELDLCLKEQKYIKSSFLTINNPSMSSTHRSSGNGNGLNLRGVETTRQRSNGHSFIKSVNNKY